MAPDRVARKIVIAAVGGLVVVIGIILIPLPGPGTLIVLAGLAILGTEFEAARRQADRIKGAIRKVVGLGDPGTDTKDEDVEESVTRPSD